ncbi:MAG TPA: HDOD domain-containing protein, partial [Sedimenticola sp.]|nr:HDOD domain-containing protein [Sedimenticola sp.]
DVARIISKDTSMAARLVRYANSPLYRGINNVASVKAAITRIGIDAVKHAILSLAMRDVFTTCFRSIQERMEALWKHSVEVATRAAMLAAHFRHLNSDEAMLAGLIHDVGVIPILIKAKSTQTLLDDEEKLDKVIRVLHMSVGKFLLGYWSFEPALVDVAANHDRLDRQPVEGEVDYVDIVQVANVLSHRQRGEGFQDTDLSRIPAFQRVGMTRVEELQQQIEAGSEPDLGMVLH